jgi:Pyruvate/2-oxoglutarate dehydrogenase complex, dihydrolipoamide acyltransferase (E2) component, and related enzymes
VSELIRVPDIGSGDGEVIELFVKVGDRIEADQSILTLESDKASMEIPAPKAGIVKSLKIKLGDRLKEGDELLELEAEGAAAAPEAPAPAAAPAAAENLLLLLPMPLRPRLHLPLLPSRTFMSRISARRAKLKSSKSWSRPAIPLRLINP